MKRFPQVFLLFIALQAFTYCGKKSQDQVVIQTAEGDIELQLYPEKAPKTVKAFLSFVDSGFYEKSNFYRILSLYNQPMGSGAAELIQGGIYKTDRNRENIPGIPHEPTSQTGILHKSGTVSLARLEPGSATTEFFICIEDSPGFDEGGKNNPDGLGYAAFGKVVKGMDVVMRIYNRREVNQEFTPPILIINIVRK